MKILVTGAKGFVGRNLCAQLNNIKDGKARCYGDLSIEDVFEYDLDSTPEQLDQWCQECDFVFNLAGVNRPKDNDEFMKGNFGFASTLLDTLKAHKNNCPVMLSSSQQASLTGRFGNSEYGRSKKAGEDLFLEYGKETGAKVLVYRFPNLYGKWCRPNYNSAVATFCNNIANDLPITVNDPSVELELLYIDDLVEEMIKTLQVASSNLPLKGEASLISDNISNLPKGEALSEYPHRCEFDGLNIIRQPLRNDLDKVFHGVQTADPTLYGVLKEHAEHNRKNPTEAESVLWNCLRSNKLGVKFRQQHIIGEYIADFLCVEKKLIIEVDGGYHNKPEQQKADSSRSQYFYERGYVEMRFTNEEVLSDIDMVLNRIEHILHSPLLQEGTGEATYCYCPITHKATLGEIVDLLHKFADMPKTLMIPEIPSDSFAKRLYSTFLSYLPKDKAIFDLKMNVDPRGSFTELVHTLNCGQVSINISKPGITKGEHWHNTKWEQFIVVAGHGLIQLRKEGTDEVLNYEVSGDKIQSVIMLPGYTHNIINLSDTEDLVTVMYCNEIFDPNKPDTYFDPVERDPLNLP